MGVSRHVGELFPDAAAIQGALERRTRAALVRRLGGRPDDPAGSPAARPAADAAGRAKARGIGFGLELVRAVLAGRKTQTRRVVRPVSADPPRVDDCPVARGGELLYVREPWLRTGGKDDRVLYAADETGPSDRRFKPAMYMPRSAARLWLRVALVRAERLQTITPADLAAEGLASGQTLAAVWDSFYTAPGERWADDPWVWVVTFAMEPNDGPAAIFPDAPG